MQQHGSKYFARRTPSRPWGWGQLLIIQLFQNMVMLHVKLKGIRKYSNMAVNILPADPLTPSTLGDGIKRSNFNFFRTRL